MVSRFMKKHLLTSLCIFIAIFVLTYYAISLSHKRKKHSSAEFGDEIKTRSGGLSVGRVFENDENRNPVTVLHTDDAAIVGSVKCNQLTRPSQSDIRYRQTYWQVQQDGQEDVVVYSAFYDDRPIVGVLPWIQILGIRRVSDHPLWCYVWYSQQETPFVTKAEITLAGKRDNKLKEGIYYSQNLFSCQLNSSNFIPTHVSIATRLCASPTIYLEIVHNPKSDKLIHTFGVCVVVSFGYIAPELIVEWMEAYAIFGVTHVDIYNGSMDSRLDRVFDYYHKKGILEIHQIPPVFGDRTMNGVRLGSPASLNDCMMRNMYSHRFIVTVDFDEIIVPRIHNNYLDMLQYIDHSKNRTEPHYQYTFRNTYFFKYFPEDESQPKFLRTMRLRYRAQPSDYRRMPQSFVDPKSFVQPKSFVDPRRCKSVGNHFCHVRFPNSGSRDFDVSTTVALTHHYRIGCPWPKIKCDKYDKEKIVDDVMLKYKDALLPRVSTVLNEINGI